MTPPKFLYASSSELELETENIKSCADMYVEDSAEEAASISDADDKEIVLEYTLTRVLRVKSKPVIETVKDFTNPIKKGAKK